MAHAAVDDDELHAGEVIVRRGEFLILQIHHIIAGADLADGCVTGEADVVLGEERHGRFQGIPFNGVDLAVIAEEARVAGDSNNDLALERRDLQRAGLGR